MYFFARYVWNQVEPKEFINNWHTDLIAAHLEACFDEKIQNLIINVPPRTGKTTLVSIIYPVWVWINNPSKRFIFASYSSEISKNSTGKCRELAICDLISEKWGDLIKIDKSERAKRKFSNTAKGTVWSTSTGGSSNGMGGDFLIYDDPNDMGKKHSKKYLSETNEWVENVLGVSRLNSSKGVRIVVMQRCNVNDVTGFLMNSPVKWDHLILPMVYSSEIAKNSHSSIGLKDPRTKEGALLSNSLFDSDRIYAIKKPMSTFDFQSQYQQMPTSIEGNIFKKTWFKQVPYQNDLFFDKIIQSWDFALSALDTASYSACTTWGIFKIKDEDRYGAMLLSMWRGKEGYAEIRKRILRMYKNYLDTGDNEIGTVNVPLVYGVRRFNADLCLIEAKALGIPLIQDLQKSGIQVTGFYPNGAMGGKEERAMRVQHLIENGIVFLRSASEGRLESYSSEFLSEILSFPFKDSRDVVDTFTQFLWHFQDRILRHQANIEREKQLIAERESKDYLKGSFAPYEPVYY